MHPLLPGVRAVTYDLWLTLLRDVDPDRTNDLRARAVADVLSTSYDAAVRLLVESRAGLHASWERGRALTVPDLAEALTRSATGAADADLVDRVVGALEGVTTQVGVELLPEAREVLQALSGAGIALGLICDTGMSGAGHLRRVLDDLEVLPLFGVTVFSDELGVPKPGSKPFSTALAALGVDRSEAVHVGDLRRRDVAGAVGAGMRAVRYRGAHDDAFDTGPADAPHVVDGHLELLGLLGR